MRSIRSDHRKSRGRRRGAAAAELALILPVLCLIASITIDYSRLFYHWTILAASAHNGAAYASLYPTATASIQNAALTDASDLSPAPTVTVSPQGVDGLGNSYIEVTVAYTWQSLFPWPGMPATVSLSRKLRMAITPP